MRGGELLPGKEIARARPVATAEYMCGVAALAIGIGGYACNRGGRCESVNSIRKRKHQNTIGTGKLGRMEKSEIRH